VAGHFSAGSHSADRGFLRRKDGTFLSIDPPGSITDDEAHADAEGYELRAVVAPLGFNRQGDITGYFDDPRGFVHGFVRRHDGTFVIANLPGAAAGSGLGTFPSSINDSGEITGFYYTGIGVSHGFVMVPSAIRNGAPSR
jgi:hypothetical protein